MNGLGVDLAKQYYIRDINRTLSRSNLERQLLLRTWYKSRSRNNLLKNHHLLTVEQTTGGVPYFLIVQRHIVFEIVTVHDVHSPGEDTPSLVKATGR